MVLSESRSSGQRQGAEYDSKTVVTMKSSTADGRQGRPSTAAASFRRKRKTNFNLCSFSRWIFTRVRVNTWKEKNSTCYSYQVLRRYSNSLGITVIGIYHGHRSLTLTVIDRLPGIYMNVVRTRTTTTTRGECIEHIVSSMILYNFLFILLVVSNNCVEINSFVFGHHRAINHDRILLSEGRCRSWSSTAIEKTTALNALKVAIRIVGKKSSEPWIEEGIGMYAKRMKGTIDLETTWHKDDSSLIFGVDSDSSKGYTIVCLDPKGSRHSSETFSDNLYKWFEEGGSRVSFLIGGAEGLPASLRPNSNGGKGNGKYSVSLSDMTLPHQLARLFLCEQIYRSSEIRKGTA